MDKELKKVLDYHKRNQPQKRRTDKVIMLVSKDLEAVSKESNIRFNKIKISATLQTSEDDESGPFVRLYTQQQIMKLKHFNLSGEVNEKKSLTLMKLKNFILGITENDLLSIEEKEWKEMYLKPEK